MKFYYTYVLYSPKDKNIYVGWSIDLRNRLKNHRSGKVTATKDRRPLQLIYYEACLSKNLAIKREKQLKSGYGRRYLNNRLDLAKVSELVDEHA